MTTGTPTMWVFFLAFVVVALLVDFFSMKSQGAHRIRMKEAAVWSLIWVLVSFVFVGWLWWFLGGTAGEPLANQKALEFVTGYLVEKALAVDNIFVFLMVFTYFAVPPEYQKRVLMIGIVDLIFAVDSIPAIFAITTDPFIVLTSNVFAILGLRAMYFLLAGMHEKFHLLSYGLALVLAFIGTKMLLIDIYKIPVAWSLGATVTILATTMVLSLYIPPPDKPARPGKSSLAGAPSARLRAAQQAAAERNQN